MDTIIDENGIIREIKYYGISLINIPDIRNKGDTVPIITNLRSKRIKFVDRNGIIRSTDNKKSFKIIK